MFVCVGETYVGKVVSAAKGEPWKAPEREVRLGLLGVDDENLPSEPAESTDTEGTLDDIFDLRWLRPSDRHRFGTTRCHFDLVDNDLFPLRDRRRRRRFRGEHSSGLKEGDPDAGSDNLTEAAVIENPALDSVRVTSREEKLSPGDSYVRGRSQGRKRGDSNHAVELWVEKAGGRSERLYKSSSEVGEGDEGRLGGENEGRNRSGSKDETEEMIGRRRLRWQSLLVELGVALSEELPSGESKETKERALTLGLDTARVRKGGPPHSSRLELPRDLKQMKPQIA